MRAYVKDLTIRINLPTGTMQTRGRLLSVQAPKSAGRGEGSYKLCTPDTHVPVRQVYQDPKTEKLYTKDELARYVQGSKQLKEPEVKEVLTDGAWEKVTEAKKSTLPKDIVDVTIHRADAADQLWATSKNNSYLFVPDDNDPQNADMADVFRAMLSSGEYVLVSVANIHNNEGFYRLVMWRGQIVLEPIVYTDALNPHETVEVNITDNLAKVALGVAEALVRDFDAGTYEDQQKARVAAIEAGEAGESLADRIEDVERAQSVEARLGDWLDTLEKV